jgi:hypothetical protein
MKLPPPLIGWDALCWRSPTNKKLPPLSPPPLRGLRASAARRSVTPKE